LHFECVIDLRVIMSHLEEIGLLFKPSHPICNVPVSIAGC